MNYFVYLLLLFSLNLFGNDGAYYVSGNHLIPIQENDIRLQKEILSIERINDKIHVNVYYELFNPVGEKELTIGFEAFAPHGDVNGMPVNWEHPYMQNFTVDMNEQLLPYKVAIVEDSLYAQHGFINGLSDLVPCDNYCEFFYVYHFNTTLSQV